MKWITLATMLTAVTACNTTATKPPQGIASAVGSPKASFGDYQTFAFGPANPPASGYEVTARSLEVQRRLAPLVQASLQKRGYEEKAESPDLLIKITAGSGSLTKDSDQRGNPPAPTPTGFIGIDAYESSSGVGVWHGTAFAEIDPQKIDDALLQRGVEHMLADFPMRTASKEAPAP